MLSIFLKTVMKRRRKFGSKLPNLPLLTRRMRQKRGKNESPDKAGHTVAGAGQHGSCGGQYHCFYHYVTDWRHRKFHIYADTRRIICAGNPINSRCSMAAVCIESHPHSKNPSWYHLSLHAPLNQCKKRPANFASL